MRRAPVALADMDSESKSESSQMAASSNPSHTVDGGGENPRSPSSAGTTNTTSSRRHTKGLSLNFPILLPTNVQISQSPTAGSRIQSPIESARSSPHIRGGPFRSPDSLVETEEKVKARGSADFLTLLAAQERKVLELKEELQKAEADLLGLKKQWASYEAKKKRDEVKQVKKLQPVALDHVSARESVIAEEDVDEERRRRRALMERGNTVVAAAGHNSGAGLGRRGSKRVFEGSRHTRTLSLLSPITTTSVAKQAHESTHLQDEMTGAEPAPAATKLSLSRMPTLDGLMSGDHVQLGFGKTYKELAAHRRSLPPVAADLFVKQGKQVYDGVREGLWTFFEDIRQATVGEEGINGTVEQQRPTKHDQRKASKKPSKTPGKNHTNSLAETRQSSSKEPSFWGEFGLDTPHKDATTKSKSTDKRGGHVQQKSSTDSTNPPSLLPDLNDNDEVEDGWDAWDSSPVSAGDANAATKEVKKRSGDSLPWPEIQKLTPSKLTRTVSDLMREWDVNQNEGQDATDMSRGYPDGRNHFLDRPHI